MPADGIKQAELSHGYHIESIGSGKPLSQDELRRLDAYWRAANYLSVGQIYLLDKDFDALFTTDKPIIFAYHGYPWLINRLTYRRHNHQNLHVRGHKEEGTTTTPFDMTVRNDLDRFHLVSDVIDRVSKLGAMAVHAAQSIRDQLIKHALYIAEHGENRPEYATGRGAIE